MRLLEADPRERITLKEAANHNWFSAIYNKTKRASSTGCIPET